MGDGLRTEEIAMDDDLTILWRRGDAAARSFVARAAAAAAGGAPGRRAPRRRARAASPPRPSAPCAACAPPSPDGDAAAAAAFLRAVCESLDVAACRRWALRLAGPGLLGRALGALVALELARARALRASRARPAAARGGAVPAALGALCGRAARRRRPAAPARAARASRRRAEADAAARAASRRGSRAVRLRRRRGRGAAGGGRGAAAGASGRRRRRGALGGAPRCRAPQGLAAAPAPPADARAGRRRSARARPRGSRSSSAPGQRQDGRRRGHRRRVHALGPTRCVVARKTATLAAGAARGGRARARARARPAIDRRARARAAPAPGTAAPCAGGANDVVAKVLARGGVAPRRLCRLGAGAADLGGDGGGDSYGRGRHASTVARARALAPDAARLAAAWAGGAGGAAARAADAGASCEAAAAFRRAVVAPPLRPAPRAARARPRRSRPRAPAAPSSRPSAARRRSRPPSRGDAAAAHRARRQGVRRRRRPRSTSSRATASSSSSGRGASARTTSSRRSRASSRSRARTRPPGGGSLRWADYDGRLRGGGADHGRGEPRALALQRGNALRRVVLVGDDGQLPPVVSSACARSRGPRRASLFSRLRRLGARCVVLDAQGRCRPEIADVFRWRYGGAAGLGDLRRRAAARAGRNPGFAHACQFVDVARGREAAPTPHFYQNLAEAEYVVAVWRADRPAGAAPARVVAVEDVAEMRRVVAGFRRRDGARRATPAA
ncbi:hypothetical protein SO694_00041276 [Aureococcus anophagefferens]|uniref:DNA2/NAM7 helicase helicase domain-containing protein n=1 Tax=Aureococcus anophagefferens TaxID=44056 RepID=A0ABR1G6M1_AURAN